jgi:hypothetical protein
VWVGEEARSLSDYVRFGLGATVRGMHVKEEIAMNFTPFPGLDLLPISSLSLPSD